MSFLSFAAIIVFIYISYYAVLITGDIMKAKRIAAIKQQPVHIIPADMFIEEETPVKVDISTLAGMMDAQASKFALPAKENQEIIEVRKEADTISNMSELQMETITYGIEISPENIAGLFTEQGY